MTLQKIKNILDVISSVSVICAVCLVIGVYVHAYSKAKGSPRSYSAPHVGRGLVRGMTIKPIGSLSYADAEKTLILALNTSCTFCRASTGFYRELTALQQRTGNKHRIVAVFPNAASEVEKFADRFNLRAITLADIPLATVNVSATPSLLLVDSHGKLLDFWIGKLSPSSEEAVRRIIGK